MTLSLGSLFDGVAGFPLAFSRAGVATKWVVELDEACRRVSGKHFPDAEAFADVRDCGAHNLAPVDIITGGFPCQGMSVAGRGLGLADERSGLFFEIVRIVREMREATDGACPNYVLLENVPGLYSANARRDFAVVISQLIGLGAVDVGFRICDAQYWGLAQRRRRVFIVLRFGAGPSSAQILSLSSGGGRDSAPRRAAGEGAPRGAAGGAGVSFKKRGGFGWSESHGVVGTLESEGGTHQGGPERVPLVGIPEVSGPRVGRSGEGGFRQDLDNHGAYIPVAFTQNQRDEVRGLGGLSGALAAQPGVHQQTYVAQPVAYSVAVRGREDGQEWELGEAEVGNALRAGDGGSSRGNWALVPEEDPGRGTPLVPVCPGGDTSKSYWKPADIANTVTSGNFPYQGTRIAYPNMAVRRLTPLECARLQGYPDDWLDGLGLSDSTKYRQLGNSIAVPVVAWIAARLVAAAE